jgi:hypothetical protein
VRRFERVQPGVPQRHGINPFTKEPIVIPPRPERTTRCDLELQGAEVSERWSWLEGTTPVGEPDCEVRRFASHEEARDDVEEVVGELLLEDFHEVTRAPHDERPPAAPIQRTLVVRSTAGELRQLSAAIVKRCRDAGWFGCDMALKPNVVRPRSDSVEWKRFRHAPATDGQLVETERLLGFALPPALRTVYAEVANGGFGPGYGFVGAVGGASDSVYETHLAAAYRQDRESARAEGPVVQWPRRVLRFLDWGCNIVSCIDARSGRILRYEFDSGVPEEDMTVEADSLEEWLRRWLQGGELFYAGQRRSPETS